MPVNLPDVQTNDTGETEYSTSQQDAGKASGTTECNRIEIEPTKNGGFSVRCFYRQRNDAKGVSPAYMDPETYAFSTFAELTSYLAQQFGQAAAPASAEGGAQ